MKKCVNFGLAQIIKKPQIQFDFFTLLSLPFDFQMDIPNNRDVRM